MRRSDAASSLRHWGPLFPPSVTAGCMLMSVCATRRRLHLRRFVAGEARCRSLRGEVGLESDAVETRESLIRLLQAIAAVELGEPNAIATLRSDDADDHARR